ncbi:MAG: trehalase family glycosidase [Candidatus Hydrogenedentota bacterium]
MWELTSSKGLNWAVEPTTDSKVAFALYDKKNDSYQDRFLYNIGQPIPDPPIHSLHKDIPAGNIKKILAFPDLSTISLICEYMGNEYNIEFIGSNLNIIFNYKTLNYKNPCLESFIIFNDKRIKIPEQYGSYVFNQEGEYSKNAKTIKIKQERLNPIKTAVLGNTLRDKDTGLLYISVNRAWVEMMSKIVGYNRELENTLVFIWDAAFNSLLANSFDLKLAEQNLKLLFYQQDKDGMLHQVRVGNRKNNLTGLPIVSYVVWKMYKRWKNKRFLKWIYPELKKWHLWLKKNRDKNNDGLLEWGCENEGDIIVSGSDGGFYESGLDDSPMWKEAEWDDNLRTFKMNCVDLSSIFCLDSLILSFIALELKKRKESLFFKDEYIKLKKIINERLWDNNRKLYVNRHWDGKFSSEISPTSFYPLLAKIPDRESAYFLIKKLFDERFFFGEYIIPSISKDSKYYNPDGDYWAGRVWPPMNYLVYEGVRLYDRKSADILYKKYKEIFFREWEESGHIHENYSALTGRGEPEPGTYARSCPFYTWGGLLILY